MFLVCVSFEKQNTDYKQTNSENRLWIGLPTHLHFKNTRSITICVYEKLSHIPGRWTDFIPKIEKSFLRLQSYFSKRRSGIFNFFCCLEAFIFIIIIYLLLLLLTLNMINFSKWFIKNYTNTKAENSAKLTENKIKIIIEIKKKEREIFIVMLFVWFRLFLLLLSFPTPFERINKEQSSTLASQSNRKKTQNPWAQWYR